MGRFWVSENVLVLKLKVEYMSDYLFCKKYFKRKKTHDYLLQNFINQEREHLPRFQPLLCTANQIIILTGGE